MIDHGLKHAPVLACSQTRRTFEQAAKEGGIFVADKHVTPHSLRRTFVTIGIASCGIDFYKVELLTNHIPHASVTAVHYLETSNLRYLRRETQSISDWIEGQAAIATGANVVPLHAGTA